MIDNKDKIIITEDDFKMLQTMDKNLYNHPSYDTIFANSTDIEIEKEVYFEYRVIQCRAKLDLVNHYNNLLIDYKVLI
jgi:hypothetical protein